MESKNINIEFIKKQMTQLITDLEMLDEVISTAKLHNEQFVLNFYDKLNEISIRK